MMRPMTCATPPVFPATRPVFARILNSAVLAGAAAGLIAALLQLVFVQPVLLHGEMYESGALVHFGTGAASTGAASTDPDLPGLDAKRTGLSILFTMLTYTGFGLVMVAAMSMAARQGHGVTARTGLVWGLAGFLAFQFAPGLSLPPEIPGSAAADVAERQIWWGATVAATALALWLIAFGRNWAAWGGAIVLLLAPHLIGAPAPAQFSGPVPPELGALFATRAFGAGLAGWVLLGCFAGYFWQRDE